MNPWRFFLTARREAANEVLASHARAPQDQVLARLAALERPANILATGATDPDEVDRCFLELVRLAARHPRAQDPLWQRLEQTLVLAPWWLRAPVEVAEVLRTPVPGAEPQAMWRTWLALMAACPPPGHALGAGATGAAGVVGVSVSPTRLAVLAGWRHGAVRLRDAALGVLALSPDTVCPALGAGTRLAAELAARSRSERWWWPAGPRPARHVVGGFRGDGGTWLERPRLHSADDQAWYVVADGLLWAIIADVHGAAVVPAGDAPEGATVPTTDLPGPGAAVLSVLPRSYRLLVRAPQ